VETATLRYRDISAFVIKTFGHQDMSATKPFAICPDFSPTKIFLPSFSLHLIIYIFFSIFLFEAIYIMPWCMRSGVTGNILIHSTANRINTYNVWQYSEGHDDLYDAMLIDLTQPRNKVRLRVSY